MAFPPLGIDTLSAVVRQHGYQVRMFDTCHLQMKPHHIAQAVKEEQPVVIAIATHESGKLYRFGLWHQSRFPESTRSTQ